jgi:hypothetical protein
MQSSFQMRATQRHNEQEETDSSPLLPRAEQTSKLRQRTMRRRAMSHTGVAADPAVDVDAPVSSAHAPSVPSRVNRPPLFAAEITVVAANEVDHVEMSPLKVAELKLLRNLLADESDSDESNLDEPESLAALLYQPPGKLGGQPPLPVSCAQRAEPCDPAAPRVSEPADPDWDALNAAAYHVALAAYFIPVSATTKDLATSTPPRWHRCFRAGNVDTHLPTAAAASGAAATCASADDLVRAVRLNLGIKSKLHSAIVCALRHGDIALPAASGENMNIKNFLVATLLHPMEQTATGPVNRHLAVAIYEALLSAVAL